MPAQSKQRACRATLVSAITFLGLAAISLAQEHAGLKEPRSTDVVILSLMPLSNPEEQHRKHTREQLGVDSGMEMDFTELFKTQMEIVRKTAPFGPVLLIVPDETTKSVVYDTCKQLQICELIRGDRIRMKVVAHEGPWIRDFGPQIEGVHGTARVVHWRYFDNRSEQARNETLEKLDSKLAKLFEVKAGFIYGDTDSLLQEASEERQTELLNEVDSQISFLRDYDQFLRKTSLQRVGDEASAYDFADAALRDPKFTYISSKAAVDGGNLLKLDDGSCLTTRVLLSRNKDTQTDVYTELRTAGGCKKVVFLDPLPGPVIEHADMFVLPAGGKRILLASYDLADPTAKSYWEELSNAEQFLSLNAAVVMDQNADRLTQLGYEVIRVPSPFPRVPNEDEPYYPTVLNALVRPGKDGSRQVLLPVYEGYDEDIQKRAWDVIQNVFGANTELEFIESTAAAKAQGAVHCLTLTLPLTLSIFNDPGEKARRAKYLALKEDLDRAHMQELAKQIPGTGEQGLWAMLEEDEEAGAETTKTGVSEIHFAHNEFQTGMFNQTVLTGQYEIQKTAPDKWAVVFQFRDGDTLSGVLVWEGRDRAKLSFPEKDEIMLLVRLNDDPEVPFDTAKESEQNAETPTKHTQGHHKRSVGQKQVRSAPLATP